MKTTLRTPEEARENGEGSTGTYPTFSEGEEDQDGTRELQVQLSVPGNVVRRIRSTEIHGRIPVRRNGMVNSFTTTCLKIMTSRTDWKELEPDTSKISQDLREIQKTVQDYGHRLIHIPIKIENLSQKMDDPKDPSRSTKSTSSTPEGKGDGSSKVKNQRRTDPKGIVELVNVQTNEIAPALPPPEGSTGSNDPPPDHPMRESTNFHTNATPILKDSNNHLELDRENFIRLVELSLEGSVKIGWDNTPEDTKANILTGDSKSAIAERLGRLIKHFIGDGYFEGSKAEKAREYAQALFGLELRSICAENQASQERGRSRTTTPTLGVPDELLSDEDHGGPNPSQEPTTLGKGPDQQGAKGHISPDCPQKHGELRKFEATNDILDAVYYGDLVPVYQFEDIPSDESVYEEEIETDSDGSSIESDPYDGFRIGGISRVLNQIGLNQRRHHIIYKVSSGDFAIPMELTENMMEMQLIPKEEILEELSKLREEVPFMKWIHIGAIEVVIKATFKEGIDSEIHLSIMDRRINNLRDGCLGTMIGNLYAGKLMFDIHPRITYNLADQDFSRVLTLHQDFKRKDLMKEGNRPYSITYRIAQQGLIESDSFYEESEKEIINLKEALHEIKPLDISEESRLSLENVKRLIQRNFSENPLAWWDRNKIEATLKVKEECKYEYVRYKSIQMNMNDKKDMQEIIKEHINLGLIEPGVSAYSSPDFLIKMESESKKFTAFFTPQGKYLERDAY
ncbi:UNVERIFIED_CONTAM: movement protein [Sesamum latifolium]|uniref:Movement protein n=1 Tax=Sesamum latifolium TaxID=2727402 RepID=A0AAW2Y6T1_9LAMI